MIRRLLVVDDEERIREIVQVCLEELAGWDVVSAASGQDALLQAKTEAIHAILLDVSMPGIDGFSFVRQLHSYSDTRSIPVILLTARSLPIDSIQLAEMGIAGVISKPFDALTLSAQIAEILGWESDRN